MQRGAPTLIYYGDCDVAKFRNISPAERRAAAGKIVGSGGRFRGGPVTVTLKQVRPGTKTPSNLVATMSG